MHFSSALRLRADPFERGTVENDLSTGLSKRDSVELAAGMLPVYYPKGGMFFLEGQPATGVFLLRTGRVKESVASNRGKIAIVRIIGPGSILGLSAVLTDGTHESTVETLEPTHADFVRKVPFLRVLKTSGPLSQMVASQLSRNCKESYAAIRFLGIAGSVSERLARLLLYWAECEPVNHDRAAAGVKIRVTLTHEEISQFIGSTRETMSRTLGEFREKKWIAVSGSTWTITNKDAIQRLAGI